MVEKIEQTATVVQRKKAPKMGRQLPHIPFNQQRRKFTTKEFLFGSLVGGCKVTSVEKDTVLNGADPHIFNLLLDLGRRPVQLLGNHALLVAGQQVVLFTDVAVDSALCARRKREIERVS
jgi:hypothetical protein